tara:strand:+ start:284 stop:922 length:639 start_codon:yes stop_codon:yes gene_type:complete
MWIWQCILFLTEEKEMSIGLRTLVLNADFAPVTLFPLLQTIPVEDAITRMVNGTCYVVEEYDREILQRGTGRGLKWPSVVAKADYEDIVGKLRFDRDSSVPKEYLYYRDHGRCMYCEEFVLIGKMTVDHVVPQSRGGSSEWDNIVVSCEACNLAKDNQMPVGIWRPKRKPYKPTYWQLVTNRKKYPIHVDHESWVPFLGKWDSDIIVRGLVA